MRAVFIVLLLTIFLHQIFGATGVSYAEVDSECYHNGTTEVKIRQSGKISCDDLIGGAQNWRLVASAKNKTIKITISKFTAITPCEPAACEMTSSTTPCDSITIFDGADIATAHSLSKTCHLSTDEQILATTTGNVALVRYVRGGNNSDANLTRSFTLKFEEKEPPTNPRHVPTETKSSSDAKSVALGIAVGTAVLVLLGLAIGFYCHYYRKKTAEYRKSVSKADAAADELDGLNPAALPTASSTKPRASSIKPDPNNKQRVSSTKQLQDSNGGHEFFIPRIVSGEGQRPSVGSGKSVDDEDVIINDVVFDLPSNHTEIPPQQLRICTEPIGIGSFGVIYQGTYIPARAETPGDEKPPSRQMVAVKKLRMNNESYRQALEAELKLLTYIGPHTYICELLGAITEPDDQYCLVMEYCEMGSLQQFVNNFDQITNTNSVSNCRPPNITVGDLLLFAEQIANGMHYIHYRKCVHRDLAARNVLLTAHRVPKITDFGIARTLNPNAFFMTKHDGEFPWKWCAIEVLTGDLLEPRSDIWSFGVLLWEIFSLGRKPFSEVLRCSSEFIEALVNGSRLPCPNKTPKAIYTLMLQCWRNIPADRPAFTELERALLGLRTSY